MKKLFYNCVFIFVIALCISSSASANVSRSSQTFIMAFNEGEGQYLLNSRGDNFSLIKDSKGTVLVNISRNASDSALAISLTDTAGNIVKTKYLSGTGTSQFLNIESGEYYVYIWNDGVSTVINCNVYY